MMIFFECTPDPKMCTYIICGFWSQTTLFLCFLMVSWVFLQLFFKWNHHFWRDLGNSFSEWYRTSLYYLWSWNDSHIISRKYRDFAKRCRSYQCYTGIYWSQANRPRNMSRQQKAPTSRVFGVSWTAGCWEVSKTMLGITRTKKNLKKN